MEMQAYNMLKLQGALIKSHQRANGIQNNKIISEPWLQGDAGMGLSGRKKVNISLYEMKVSINLEKMCWIIPVKKMSSVYNIYNLRMTHWATTSEKAHPQFSLSFCKKLKKLMLYLLHFCWRLGTQSVRGSGWN